MTAVSAPPISFAIVDSRLDLAMAKVQTLQQKYPGADFNTFYNAESVIGQLLSGAFDNPSILITANDSSNSAVELLKQVAGKAGFKGAIVQSASVPADLEKIRTDLKQLSLPIQAEVMSTPHTDEQLFAVIDAMIKTDVELREAAQAAAE